MSTYVPPPPAPPRRGSSAPLWIGLGCGGCAVLIVVFGLFMYFTVGKVLGPAMKDSMQVAMDLANLREAVMEYRKDTGKYPDKLEDLVPKYIRSSANLKPATHPEGPQYTYYKPGPNAQDDAVLLEYTLTVDTRDGQKISVPVQMQINGQTRRTRGFPTGRTQTGAPARGQPGPAGAE